MKGFHREKWVGQGNYTSKELIVVAGSLFFWGTAEAYWADYFTGANQVIPDWFKILFLGSLKLQLG